MSDNYHHGDLRNALIETGIRIVNECGEKGLSLRKLAAACGVSNAAPYAHFSGKEELIQAMQEYVTEKFTGRLQEAIDRKVDEGAEQMILAMGKAYVLFFVENPTYFTFLFSGDSIHAHLSLDQPDTDDYPLYLLMKKLYFRMNEENGRICTRKEQELELIRIWSSVQGLASIVCMKNVVYDGSWEEAVEAILK